MLCFCYIACGVSITLAEQPRTITQKLTDLLQPVSYLQMERATRIELATSAWEADVLPLNYARNRVLIYYPTKRAKSQVFSKFERIFC